MRRFRFFPSSILSFFWGSPLKKGEEFKTATRDRFLRMHWYSRNVLLEIRVMVFYFPLRFVVFKVHTRFFKFFCVVSDVSNGTVFKYVRSTKISKLYFYFMH